MFSKLNSKCVNWLIKKGLFNIFKPFGKQCDITKSSGIELIFFIELGNLDINFGFNLTFRESVNISWNV